MTKNIGIIFAGGIGSRMGNQPIPKQFLMVLEKPVIIHTLEYFEKHSEIDDIYISCIESWIDHLKELLIKYNITKVRRVVPGGSTGQGSIYNALVAAREDNDGDSIVLIHDGVRPFITKKLISELIECTKKNGNAITCTPCNETIMISSDRETVGQVPFRKETFAAQAPQTFRLDEIIDAHNKMIVLRPTYDQIVDSCTMFRVLDKKVHMVFGNRGNIKITEPEDLYLLKGLFEYRTNETLMGVSYLETGEK